MDGQKEGGVQSTWGDGDDGDEIDQTDREARGRADAVCPGAGLGFAVRRVKGFDGAVEGARHWPAVTSGRVG